MPSFSRMFAEPHKRFWLAGILLLVLALRVWDLGARSLWFDEASEYWVATAPLTQISHFVSVGSGDPPLYSFLLHFWMKLGTGEIWLRSLALIASVAGVIGVMVLGRRVGGFPTAVAAGLLAAVNPPDIRYAQEVGQYALMLGTLAWSLVALHGLWNEGGWKWVLAWALTAFLASTAYYAAAFTVGVPLGCALVEAALRRDGQRLRRLAAALGLYILAVAPVLWTVLPGQLARVLDTRALLADYPQQRPEGVALVWRWISNLFAFHFTGWPYTRVPGWIPIVCWFALLGLALRARPRWTLWFAAHVGRVRHRESARAVSVRVPLGIDPPSIHDRALRDRRYTRREYTPPQVDRLAGVRGAHGWQRGIASKPDGSRRRRRGFQAAVARDRGHAPCRRVLARTPNDLATDVRVLWGRPRLCVLSAALPRHACVAPSDVEPLVLA